MVLAGCNLITSFDPSTGKKLWEVNGSTEECVVTAVTDGERVFTSGGYPKNHTVGIVADGSGKVAWQNNARVYVPSMIAKAGHLYAVMDAGVAAIVHELAVDDPLLGHEWEWDNVPELALVIVDDLLAAVAAFNRFSPRLAASLISDDPAAHEVFYAAIDAPFVGNGFTRWVDGQFALGQPELGLSNWQSGRLFGRGGVLSGDSVHTIRLRARIADHRLRR